MKLNFLKLQCMNGEKGKEAIEMMKFQSIEQLKQKNVIKVEGKREYILRSDQSNWMGRICSCCMHAL